MIRRVLLLVSVAAVATACGTNNSDTARMGRMMLQAIEGRDAQMIPRDRAAAVPYASLGVQVGDGDQGLLVLGTAAPPNLEWYGGEDIMVRTRDGRIIRTAGLPYDLGGLEQEPLGSAGTTAGSGYRMRYDFPDLGIFGAVGECVPQSSRPETIQILGASIATQHVTEQCSVPALKWRFEVEFWRDASSQFVWRSRQRIHPKLPPVTLETFRPVADAG
jgi:hypothetical protein